MVPPLTSPWEPPPPGLEPWSLAATERRAARFAWLERRRFEVLGGWTATVAELDVKALLATEAHHHAWHASLWEAHLPHRSGHDPAALEMPVDDAVPRVIDTLSRATGTVERLVGAHRVLAAHAVAAYTSELERSDRISGAAVARTCRLVLADQLEHWRRGERALQALLVSGDDVARAGAHQVLVEGQLVAAGGYAGTDDLGRAAAGRST